MNLIWPLQGCTPSFPPPHGLFGAVRRYDVHTGIDLYCKEGQAVVSMLPGRVVAIEPFTGPKADSPWWFDTKAVLIESDVGVLLYGEIEPQSDVCVGCTVEAGQLLGVVRRVLRNDKGSPTCMLHVELYRHGTTSSVWWKHSQEKPSVLLDPTSLLHLAAEFGDGNNKILP